MTTSSIASSKSSGKRDMWTPFCAGSRSTVAVDLGRDEHLVPAVAHPHRLLDAGDARARERDPNLGRRGLEVLRERCGLGHARKGSKLTRFRGLVSLQQSREPCGP